MKLDRKYWLRGLVLLMIFGLVAGMSSFAAAKQATGEPTDPDGEPTDPDSGEPTDPESAPIDEAPSGWQESMTTLYSWQGVWVVFG